MDAKHENEKMDITPAPTRGSESPEPIKGEQEVFQITEDGVDFRTVTWPRAAIVFLKILFATGVLSVPPAMHTLGAAGGALVLIAVGCVNCYVGKIQGDFRNKHPSCHSIADMIGIVGGPIVRELFGGLYIIAWVLCSGSGINGSGVAFNALSEHGACTVWFNFVSMIIVATMASVRTFQNIGWLGWVGFISIYSAVFILVVAVTQVDRPAAAPKEGPIDLDYVTWGVAPTFAAGMVATTTIFVSSAGTSAFIPVIAEMRRPSEFNKALYLCMFFVTASYLTFASVIYAWCGVYITAPALGSAGGTIKKVCYGVGLLGLLISGAFYCHVAAKYLFVRILRNSKHLQSNSLVHWATWLTCTFGLASLAFLLAQAIPIFNYLIAITGSFCFAPLALMVPAWIWMWDHSEYKRGTIVQKLIYGAHILLMAIGALIFVGGTYGTIKAIVDAYANGTIGGAFSCADNSGTVLGSGGGH
ncbi:N amino acid transport system protein [Cyphellophora attinorum]|uniref:N amino acid transport system protein n=1 Tax=Cyphellophora attinorum TaxID=1664694 RepID=A0A0N0NKL9_9EURO|nr:N amino acid transport system protein [Phialophora attinorum]KPI38301.1 N amino acid transport system protein [Phialophora attinorum]